MKVRSLAFRTDLLIRRSAGSVIADHPSHLVVRTPANPHFWWGNFVLVAPEALPDAPALFATEFPDASHLAIGVDGTEGDAGHRAEWERLGITVETDAVLTASALRAPVPPERVVLRPLTESDWGQAEQLRRACDELGPSEKNTAFRTAKLAEERRLCEAGDAVWFGAFVDGVMRAGLGVVHDGQGLARYQHVETHPRFRRRGLASSLVHFAGTEALAQGARTLVIVADPEGGAMRIYRALGFVETERQVRLQRAVGTAPAGPAAEPTGS
ncbi:Acetyltransferase (GNAT) domain-containing protein [Actinomadura meyerae]|uniref:Acetyltransferase (GNAT) domain-containing protein n=1 Tax=Actinomadura meyerae TaxID=240840 RepID=A0A239MTY4_9ACTN|nr:GNAT family N-acetyltransferase [Actinomadura meyerae]SNT46267.1 Acetyltransferase (GNAT) domain-containing protein [Actinomadura meyerae]